jgi:hypothetical protein
MLPNQLGGALDPCADGDRELQGPGEGLRGECVIGLKGFLRERERERESEIYCVFLL